MLKTFFVHTNVTKNDFIKKEAPTVVFSCEFCETFKSIFFIKHLRWLLLLNLCKDTEIKALSCKSKAQQRKIIADFKAGLNHR